MNPKREPTASVIYPTEVTPNDARAFGSGERYYPAYMSSGPNRRAVPLLFTANQLEVAAERATRNPEDVPPQAHTLGERERAVREVVAFGLGILLAILVMAFSGAAEARAPKGLLSDRYDAEIQKAARLYLPGWRWEWWKAQLYQESRLDPSAVSPAGARGLAQFMPGTWRDEAGRLGFGHLSPHAAEPSILAGAAYMARLRAQWRSERPESDRRELAQASYNAGLGNILRAQQRCQGARHWPEIQRCLPQVTGERNAHETRTYVERIARWYGVLVVSS
jgi:soluble lytic murein transglycosylase-like protein